MKLLGNTENKINKDKNGEIVPYFSTLPILVTMIINKIREPLYICSK